MESVAAIIRAGVDCITSSRQFLFENDVLTAAAADDRGHMIARGFQRARLRIDNCRPDAASDDYGMANMLDMCRLPERAGNIGNLVSRLEGTHLVCRCADRLHDQGNGLCGTIGVRDGERNPLTVLRHPNDYKLAGSAMADHMRRFYLEPADLGRERRDVNDAVGHRKVFCNSFTN